MLPKTSAYAKGYDGQTKWMCFLIEDDDLLEKYNAIWDKVSASSIKWTVLAHFLTPNFTPKILTHKIPASNTHA